MDRERPSQWSEQQFEWERRVAHVFIAFVQKNLRLIHVTAYAAVNLLWAFWTYQVESLHHSILQPRSLPFWIAKFWDKKQSSHSAISLKGMKPKKWAKPFTVDRKNRVGIPHRYPQKRHWCHKLLFLEELDWTNESD
jgi:hypothetical protein